VIFLARRAVQLIFIVIAVTAITYFAQQLLPGDPAIVICGTGGPECVAQQREKLHLDESPVNRYLDWAGGAVRGDLGVSAITQQPVRDALGERIPYTLALVIYSQIIALGIAIPVGMLAAQKQGSLFDRTSTGCAFGGLALPAYIAAPPLVALFAVKFHIFNATGASSVFDIRGMFLPALVLAIAEMATYMRLFRSDLISTLQEDYITMAKAKGLSPRSVMFKHAFRSSSFSLITVAGLNFGRLIGGTLIVEVFFAIPGVGKYLVESVFKRDYLAVQGAVVLITVAYVFSLFLLDAVYALLDPRIRHARVAV
jgi:peptide/nickel transport system permease protein